VIFLYFQNINLYYYLRVSNTNCPNPEAIRWCKNIAENYNPVGKFTLHYITYGATTSQTTDTDGRLVPYSERKAVSPKTQV